MEVTLMQTVRRTADEQYRLIMECRSSGLSDFQWCNEHGINPGTFYNWVRRLRKKFCGRRSDRIKALLHENDGFVLLYKRLDHNTGKYRWPRNRDEVKTITWRQFDWLMSGLEIEQPKAIKSG